MNGPLPSTWATRELPILRSALVRVDSGDENPNLAEIGEDTGLPPTQLSAGVEALCNAQPPFLEVQWASGWSDDRYGGGYVETVFERTRRELGTWPSADLVLQQLIDALTNAAADEPREAEKGKLRLAAEVLAGMGRDVAVGVITARIGA